MNYKTLLDFLIDLDDDYEPTPDECRAYLRASGIDPDALIAKLKSRVRELLNAENDDENLSKFVNAHPQTGQKRQI